MKLSHGFEKTVNFKYRQNKEAISRKLTRTLSVSYLTRML